MRFYEQVSSPTAHFLKVRRPISPISLLRQASASPLCLMRPARAMVFGLVPEIFPFSSTYTTISYWVKSSKSTNICVNKTYICDFNLDGRVIVGADQSVSGWALSWDVQVNNLVFIVLHFLNILQGQLWINNNKINTAPLKIKNKKTLFFIT